MSTPRKQSRWHRNLMAEYHAASQAWWEAAEYATMLYDTELREYKETHPMPLFKDFLIAKRQEREYALSTYLEG